MGKWKAMSKFKKIVAILLTAVLIAGVVNLIVFFPYKGTASTLYWTPDMVYGDAAYAASCKVYKEYGKDYKIMQFTDVQLDNNPSHMKKARELVKLGIESDRPDLIVFTGDTVQGPLGHYMLKKFVKFMDEFKIPYAPVMGNHEHDSVADMDYMAEIWESGEYCLFKKGPRTIHGYGNYFINVVEKQPDGAEKVVYMLSCIDSGGYYDWPTDKNGNIIQNNPVGATLKESGWSYDVIHPDQISYFEWQVKGIKDYVGYTVPTMAFFHIPVPEFETAWEQWAGKNTDVDPIAEGWNPNYVPGNSIPAEDGYGRRNECVGAGMFNSGFFTKATATGALTHIFAGHEHMNNFSILYEGVRLTYGEKTGPGCYFTKDMQGHTRIAIKSDVGANGFNEVGVASYHYDGNGFIIVA